MFSWCIIELCTFTRSLGLNLSFNIEVVYSGASLFFNNFSFLKCPSFSLLRNLITICIRIFLQNFGKMKKHRFFIDNLHSLHTIGWKCAVAQPIRLHHLDNRILLKLDRNTDNMFSISPMKFCNEKRKQLVYMYFDRHNRPLQKRERTGKEYGCFPFVWKTKILKWKINYILESLPWIEVFGGGKWQNGSSTNITQNREFVWIG